VRSRKMKVKVGQVKVQLAFEEVKVCEGAAARETKRAISVKGAMSEGVNSVDEVKVTSSVFRAHPSLLPASTFRRRAGVSTYPARSNVKDGLLSAE
jgi:hypothetical protein